MTRPPSRSRPRSSGFADAAVGKQAARRSHRRRESMAFMGEEVGRRYAEVRYHLGFRC
jgi:hypothetical protein